jgi:branched-chain amino acid transport system permease protein
MLYRQAGLQSTSYADETRVLRIPTDKYTAILLLILGVSAPLLVSDVYLKTYMLPWLIWTAAALGLNLVTGWAGQLHLGYAAVMAVGAYSAVHAARFGVPWEIALLIAGVSAAVIGTLFAFAALRVKGLYLALTTLAMQFVMDWILSHVPAVTGGSHATLQAPPLRLLGQAISSDAAQYYVAFGWCILVTLFLVNMRRTGLGRALVAVREKDYAAAILGVNSFVYKLVAFATSSFIAGVSGAILVATFYFLVTPEQFNVNVSIQVLAMVIVGGLAHIIGTYLGVALILLAPALLNSVIPALFALAGLDPSIETMAHIPTATYGALIVIFLLVEPLGLGKIYNNIRDHLLVWPFDQMRK